MSQCLMRLVEVEHEVAYKNCRDAEKNTREHGAIDIKKALNGSEIQTT